MLIAYALACDHATTSVRRMFFRRRSTGFSRPAWMRMRMPISIWVSRNSLSFWRDAVAL